MSGTILTGKNLRKSFNGTFAVDDVSFAIEAKTITAIIGPNGAGKTTLFNLITGFLSPDRGEIWFNGSRLTGARPHEIARRGIARTFQDLRLLRQVSVRENLLLACPHQSGERFWRALLSRKVKGEERSNQRAIAILFELIAIGNLADEPAGILSYGQQKLLTLACCLATQSNVLLLDEPVAGVHPDMATQILDHIIKLRAQGKTVVFIEHDLEVVRRIAEQVIVMDDGKIIACGPTEAVLGQKEIIEAYLT